MIAITDTQAHAEQLNEYIADALRYQRAMTAAEKNETIPETGEPATTLVSRMMAMPYLDALAELRDLWLSKSGKTTRWATPAQIPEGPHAGKWYIPLPMRDGAIRSEWVEQANPQTGELREDHDDLWADVTIAERDPAWWPEEDL